jgi:hypothetical protein
LFCFILLLVLSLVNVFFRFKIFMFLFHTIYFFSDISMF